jgi:hypothetical protein
MTVNSYEEARKYISNAHLQEIERINSLFDAWMFQEETEPSPDEIKQMWIDAVNQSAAIEDEDGGLGYL